VGNVTKIDVNKEFEQVVVSMVESILHLFKIHGEVVFGNTTVVVENVLGKTPESFDAIDMILGLLVDHPFGVADRVMFSETLEGVVALEFVGEVHRSLPCFLSNDLHQIFSRHSFHNPRVDPPIPLQKAKYNAFAPCTTSALSFASATKVALVHFDLARELAALELCNMVDGFAKALVDTGDGLVVEAEIVGKLVCGLLLVEAFEDSQFSSELSKRLLFFAGFVPAPNVPAACSRNPKRTAENAFSAVQKVGRTTENVLSPLCHMDSLVPYGYVSH